MYRQAFAFYMRVIKDDPRMKWVKEARKYCTNAQFSQIEKQYEDAIKENKIK